MNKYLFPILLLVLLGLPLVYQSTPTEVLKLKTFDALIPEQDPSGYFTVLNITDDDINREGGYPLSRQRLSEINAQVTKKGAIGIGWVVTFPNKGRLSANGDQAFADSLAQIPSVLAMFENDKGIYPKTTGTVILGNDVGGTLATGVTQNIPILANSSNQGIAVARPEVDLLVRRIPLLLRTPDGWVPAFGTEVLKILAGASTYVIKTNDNGLEEIRVRGLPPVPVDSLGRKWISFVNTPQTDLKEMDVKDKFVFIGFTAKGIMPQLGTPSGKFLEPHLIQAALAESILIEGSPYVPDYALAVEVGLFTFSVLFVWLLLHLFGITWGLVFFSITMASTAYYGFWTIQQGVLIDVTWTLISQFITGAVAFYLRFREQYKLRQQIKKQFEHYLDPRQVKQLQDNPDLLKLGGEKRYCTFLFTDVRGFTSMSESLEPEQVTYIMNRALTAQQSAVQKHHGMVDKYIGDAMMAIFSAPLDLDFHENKAIECAKDIQKNMEELNIELATMDIPPVAIGIGINTGYAIIGNMGSESRFDYTAIGDAVNTAARLESGTKEAGVDLLIGYNTAIKCDYELRLLEPLKVKGKEKPLQVYTLE
jgi:adenylate cyclase